MPSGEGIRQNKNGVAVMKEFMFKPHYLRFKAWIWAFASISSCTMHVPWDSVGCFRSVGDFFHLCCN
ncbi:hypothetical protein L1987_14697 [Smallanthus sonchifolius]|uniref:Uncharacterized protein n=1 Tax=Smallanthus sonchifolius TaxID=185202 RepID=A0ACB9J644_9ASTR|nr:hypothetical protein L1987_14697 [Smallanthus sonchifolius]